MTTPLNNNFESLIDSMLEYNKAPNSIVESGNFKLNPKWVHLKGSDYSAELERNGKLSAYELASKIEKNVADLKIEHFQINNLKKQLNILEDGLKKLEKRNHPSNSIISSIFSNIWRFITGRKTLGTINEKIRCALVQISQKKEEIKESKEIFKAGLKTMERDRPKQFRMNASHYFRMVLSDLFNSVELDAFKGLDLDSDLKEIQRFFNVYAFPMDEPSNEASHLEDRLAVLIMTDILKNNNNGVELGKTQSTNIIMNMLSHDRIAHLYWEVLLHIHLEDKPNLLNYLTDSPGIQKILGKRNNVYGKDLNALIQLVHAHKFQSIANSVKESVEKLLTSVEGEEGLEADRNDLVTLILNGKKYQMTFQALSKFSPLLETLLETLLELKKNEEAKKNEEPTTLDLDKLTDEKYRGGFEKYRNGLARLFEGSESIFNPEIDPESFEEFIEMTNYFQLDLETNKAMHNYHELLKKYAIVKDDLRAFMNK